MLQFGFVNNKERNLTMDAAYNLLDQGYIPDRVLRPVIRQLCRKRLREIDHGAFGSPTKADVS